MAVTKATLVARRVEYIEAALEKLEGELENASEAHRQKVLTWIASVHEALRKRGLLTMH
jgi:hypothetical protein